MPDLIMGDSITIKPNSAVTWRPIMKEVGFPRPRKEYEQQHKQMVFVRQENIKKYLK
jgi:hypothetical protein